MYSEIAKTWVLIILLPIIVSSAVNHEPNNSQPITERTKSIFSEELDENIITKEFLSRFDILLGFALGLFSTFFVDHLRKRRKTREFRQGMRAELKQILALMNTLALNPDADITREKLGSWISLSNEFDLHKEVFPLRDDRQLSELMKKILSEKDLNDFISLHSDTRRQREKEGNMQSIKKVNCAFIQNNISCISLLRGQERSYLFNMLRYVDLINMEILKLNFFFEKSYDTSVHDENRERLKINYQTSCQAISDWSYEAAKEIAHLMRQ